MSTLESAFNTRSYQWLPDSFTTMIVMMAYIGMGKQYQSDTYQMLWKNNEGVGFGRIGSGYHKFIAWESLPKFIAENGPWK